MKLAAPKLKPAPNALVVDWTNGIRQHGKTASLVTELLMIAGGVLLLSLLAHVRINIGLVPITGQTLGVLLVGAALGWDRGLASVVFYLLLGLCGAPVFANTVGPLAFFWPDRRISVLVHPGSGRSGLFGRSRLGPQVQHCHLGFPDRPCNYLCDRSNLASLLVAGFESSHQPWVDSIPTWYGRQDGSRYSVAPACMAIKKSSKLERI